MRYLLLTGIIILVNQTRLMLVNVLIVMQNQRVIRTFDGNFRFRLSEFGRWERRRFCFGTGEGCAMQVRGGLRQK